VHTGFGSISALGSSRLASALRKDGQLTLFAPTDTAFKNHRDLMMKIMSDQECVESKCFVLSSLQVEEVLIVKHLKKTKTNAL
jgi:hypothetical protein